MSVYSPVIAQALTDNGYTAYTDTATLVLIEDCMRTNRTALDHLTGDDFSIEVHGLISDLTSHPDQTRTLCDLLGFDLPGWVDHPPRRQPLSPEATNEQILATLRHAFPATTFRLTSGRGAAHGRLTLAWTGGPAKTSVDDVVAQFLPGDTLTPGYACLAIYTCRHPELPARKLR